MPFIHHFKNEKLLKKLDVSYTFIRVGYFMQNLNDFLCEEFKERQRIFVPAGKGKTSFVDVRDLEEKMSVILGKSISYTNPSAKDFKQHMLSRGKNKGFINVVIGIHFPTKLGLAKGVKSDFQKVTGRNPKNIDTYIRDYRHFGE